MSLNKRTLAVVLAAPALFFAGLANATPDTGFANILGNVNVSGSNISFASIFSSDSGALNTGDFAGLTDGTIMSLNNGPATGNTFLPKLISFTGGVAAPIYFDLTYIAPGVGTLAACNSSAVGAACTPTGSPFTLFQLPSNTVIALCN